LVTLLVGLVLAWPAENTPLPQPPPQRSYLAPLSLTYGQQPPSQGPLSVEDYLAIRGTWAEDKEPPPPQLPARRFIAPLTLAYGSQPPPAGPLAVEDFGVIRAAWPDNFAPAPQHPSTAYVAPLALVYGSQPPPAGPLAPEDLLAIGAWPAAWWPAQGAQPSAAWNVPAAPTGDAPPPTGALALGILAAWQPPFVAPPPLVRVAPLTLVYGAAPPIAGPLATEELTAILAWQPQLVGPPALVKLVPPSIDAPTPYRRDPSGLVAAWQAPFILPASARPLVQGVTPFVAAPSCPWGAILAAWDIAQGAPQRPASAALLVLVYGDSPPVNDALSRADWTAILSWQPPDFPVHISATASVLGVVLIPVRILIPAGVRVALTPARPDALVPAGPTMLEPAGPTTLMPTGPGTLDPAP
jgi:hypothetical protein